MSQDPRAISNAEQHSAEEGAQSVSDIFRELGAEFTDEGIKPIDREVEEPSTEASEASDQAQLAVEALMASKEGVDITNEEDSDEHVDVNEDDQASDESEELESDDESPEAAGKIKISNGDDDIFLDEDAVISVKVNGEYQEIPVKDFQSGLSAQKDISRRYSALANERQTLQSEFDKLNQWNAHADQLLEQGRALDAVDYYLTQRGVNPQEFLGQFFEQISAPLEKYMGMSNDEKSVWQAQVQAETNRLRYEELSTQNQQVQAQQEHLGEIKTVQGQYGMSDQDFVDAYDGLQEEIKAGMINVEKVDAALVGRYHQLTQDELLAASVLPKNAEHKVVSDVVEDIRHLRRKGHEVTAEILKEYKLSGKVAKAKKVNKALAKKKAKTQTTKSRPRNQSVKTGTFLDGILENMEGKSVEDRAKYLEKKKKQYRL